MNSHDKVLAASGLNSLLEFHSGKKLGKASIYAEGIQFIDYGAIAQPRHIGHYIPFNMLAGLIRTGTLSQGENSSTHLYINKTTNTQTMTAGTEARI
jgi:hypothetical protein